MEPSRPTVSTLLLKRPPAATGSNSRCSTTRSSYLSRVALEEPLPPSLPPSLKADWLREDQVTRPGRVDRVVILQVLSQVSAARLSWRRPAGRPHSVAPLKGEPENPRWCLGGIATGSSSARLINKALARLSPAVHSSFTGMEGGEGRGVEWRGGGRISLYPPVGS